MANYEGFTPVIPEDDFTQETYVAADGFKLPYRLYIPKNYDCGALYPLMIFMHGAGERGTGNTAQVTVALPKVFEDPNSPVYNSIVIAPQCPPDKQWVYTPWAKGNYSTDEVVESRELQAVVEIINSTMDEFNVDRDRVYVTGLSMGGFATWDLIARHGELFAAAMPVCGGGDPSKAAKLANLPIRTFHGLLDEQVPTEGTREMYAAIRAQGKGRIRYTEYEDKGHAIWDDVYSNASNINWLFSNVRRRVAPQKKVDYRTIGAAGLAIGLAGAALLLLGKKKKK